MMYGNEMIAYWSMWHWIMLLLIAVVFLYPISVILRRIGYSPFWALLALFPLLNLVGLWIVAFGPWPRNGARK